MNNISIVDLKRMCRVTARNYCLEMGVDSEDLYAEKAVMFYLGHPNAQMAQWHEEWCKLRATEIPQPENPDEGKAYVDPRMKPFAELDELEQIKYVVFLNMFRTLRQLL